MSDFTKYDTKTEKILNRVRKTIFVMSRFRMLSVQTETVYCGRPIEMDVSLEHSADPSETFSAANSTAILKRKTGTFDIWDFLSENVSLSEGHLEGDSWQIPAFFRRDVFGILKEVR